MAPYLTGHRQLDAMATLERLALEACNPSVARGGVLTG
jgi:hypothetical protein